MDNGFGFLHLIIKKLMFTQKRQKANFKVQIASIIGAVKKYYLYIHTIFTSCTSRPPSRPPKTLNPLRLLSSEGFCVLVVNPADQNSNLLYKDLEILVTLKRSLFDR